MATEVNRLAVAISAHAFNKDRTKLAISPNNNKIYIFAKKGAEWVKEASLKEHDAVVTVRVFDFLVARIFFSSAIYFEGDSLASFRCLACEICSPFASTWFAIWVRIMWRVVSASRVECGQVADGRILANLRCLAFGANPEFLRAYCCTTHHP
jgi:hypothetical protein